MGGTSRKLAWRADSEDILRLWSTLAASHHEPREATLQQALPHLHRVDRTAPDERRREPRFEWDEPAKLIVSQPVGDSTPCRIVEISMSGLRLETIESVEAGCEILVLVHHAVVFGTVRHCSPSPDTDEPKRYRVGIQIDRVAAKQAGL